MTNIAGSSINFLDFYLQLLNGLLGLMNLEEVLLLHSFVHGHVEFTGLTEGRGVGWDWLRLCRGRRVWFCVLGFDLAVPGGVRFDVFVGGIGFKLGVVTSSMFGLFVVLVWAAGSSTVAVG